MCVKSEVGWEKFALTDRLEVEGGLVEKAQTESSPRNAVFVALNFRLVIVIAAVTFFPRVFFMLSFAATTQFRVSVACSLSLFVRSLGVFFFWRGSFCLLALFSYPIHQNQPTQPISPHQKPNHHKKSLALLGQVLEPGPCLLLVVI